MRPTTTNLLLFAAVALAFIAVGGCVLQLAGNSRNCVRVLLRVFARVVIVIGFLLMGTLFWSHVSGQLGPKQVWFRAPSFYLAATFLCASAFWWFRLPVAQTRRRVLGLVGYPVLLLLLVGGWQFAVQQIQRGKSHSLHAALQASEGQLAPEIQFMDPSGVPHRLSDFKGKVVLVNFWATTCAPCIQEMPGLSQLQSRLKDRGFVLVYLSSEAPEVLARYFRGRNLDGIDGRLVPQYPVPAFYAPGKAWPMSFLISRSGVVRDTWLGAPPLDYAEKKIEQEL